ncbi:MAG: CRTAC1 family protein [Vicinamibacteraceae bacterium]
MSRWAISWLVPAAVCYVAVAAAQVATDRAVGWERARAEIAKYRTTLDNSGLVEVDARIATRVDAQDLQALCRARTDAVTAARLYGESMLAALPPGDDPITNEKRANAWRQLGAVASAQGDMVTARRHFTAARDALAAYATDYPDLGKRWSLFDEAVGVAAMRQGEIDNCLVMTGSDRCLFPVRDGGRHHDLKGAADAFATFAALADREPANLEARWLLNLSAMLLGKHPEGVPAKHRLAADLFRSKVTAPRFTDVARTIGVGTNSTAGGTIVDDFDGDGRPDILLTSVDYCAPARLYRNKGDGTFEDRTEASGLASQLGGLNASHADVDNDGDLDLFIHRGGWEIPMRNSLLRNDGTGVFTDVTKAAGLANGVFATHSAAWADYDNDGWVDLYVGHELAPSRLYRNRGDGTFEDVSTKAGVAGNAFTKGVSWGDYDNDGFPDLYASNMFGDNFLYRNKGDGTFEEIGAKLGVEKPFASFPTWWFDYDNDGWLDLFVVAYPNSVEEFVKHYLGQPPAAETLKLYRNDQRGGFTDVSAAMGVARVVPAMGANVGDIDNDGFLDVYLGTGAPSFGSLIPNILLRNDAGRRFDDVTEATGTGHLQKGHGIAFADLDGDGDQDIVLNAGGAVPGDRYDDAVFENPGTPGRHWIDLRLIGVSSNRAAIGAKIRVTVAPTAGSRGPAATRLRYREVSSGGSFGSNSYAQHVGLGAATAIESIEIEWPASKTRQVFRNPPVDTLLEIREGAEAPVVRPRPAFRLGRADGAAPPHQH